MDQIKNKTILITGAARGLGLTYTQYMLKNGAKIVSILDLPTSTGNTTVATLEKEFGKGKALFFPCDVTNVKQFEETFEKAAKIMGVIDIVINNAGVLNDKNWKLAIDVNIGGVIQGSFLALEHMRIDKGGKGGTLVNVASTVALRIQSVAPVYCAGKHQVLAFSRCLQEWYEHTGVRVLIMCPGLTKTNLLDSIPSTILDFNDAEKYKEKIDSSPSQGPEIVAETMVSLIQKGKNGSVWVSDVGEAPYAVEFPPIKKIELDLMAVEDRSRDLLARASNPLVEFKGRVVLKWEIVEDRDPFSANPGCHGERKVEDRDTKTSSSSTSTDRTDSDVLRSWPQRQLEDSRFYQVQFTAYYYENVIFVKYKTEGTVSSEIQQNKHFSKASSYRKRRHHEAKSSWGHIISVGPQAPRYRGPPKVLALWRSDTYIRAPIGRPRIDKLIYEETFDPSGSRLCDMFINCFVSRDVTIIASCPVSPIPEDKYCVFGSPYSWKVDFCDVVLCKRTMIVSAYHLYSYGLQQCANQDKTMKTKPAFPSALLQTPVARGIIYSKRTRSCKAIFLQPRRGNRFLARIFSYRFSIATNALRELSRHHRREKSLEITRKESSPVIFDHYINQNDTQKLKIAALLFLSRLLTVEVNFYLFFGAEAEPMAILRHELTKHSQKLRDYFLEDFQVPFRRRTPRPIEGKRTTQCSIALAQRPRGSRLIKIQDAPHPYHLSRVNRDATASFAYKYHRRRLATLQFTRKRPPSCEFSFLDRSSPPCFRSWLCAKRFVEMETVVNVSHRRRRSSASEKAKEIEAINGIVSGKNVLITGGAAGLGIAFLNHFLKHGANRITIFDIDAEAGKRIETSVEKSCGEKKVHFIHVDVSNYARMAEAFEETVRLMNDIDIVVNNAGILDERRWEREIAVNIGGMISTAMLSVKYMNRDKVGHGGTLVNVSQHIDIKNTAQLPVYTATKHAIIGLSQSLANTYQYETTGIRVITLCPGLTETALTVDSPNKLLSRVMKADFVKNLEQLSIQTPYVVAQGLMSILRVGESGSIWVVENGRSPYEVYVPNPRTLRRMYKNNFTLVETKPLTRGRPIREVCDNTRTGLMSCA
ncbi:uncharacterized protein LOC143362046 [Halictus rubicundus]|uniref:uncharacterized protein LOC143362046 n=1 Tax=Halictus rubicundus TaxID=77578 RepID=UPI004035FBFE